MASQWTNIGSDFTGEKFGLSYSIQCCIHMYWCIDKIPAKQKNFNYRWREYGWHKLKNIKLWTTQKWFYTSNNFICIKVYVLYFRNNKTSINKALINHIQTSSVHNPYKFDIHRNNLLISLLEQWNTKNPSNVLCAPNPRIWLVLAPLVLL